MMLLYFPTQSLYNHIAFVANEYENHDFWLTVVVLFQEVMLFHICLDWSTTFFNSITFSSFGASLKSSGMLSTRCSIPGAHSRSFVANRIAFVSSLPFSTHRPLFGAVSSNSLSSFTTAKDGIKHHGEQNEKTAKGNSLGVSANKKLLIIWNQLR